MTTAVRLATADELTKLYGINTGHLYVLAHRKKWRRIKHDGRTYYDLDDADRDLGSD